MYYAYILNMWMLGKITAAQVDLFVSMGKITGEEGETIKNTPR